MQLLNLATLQTNYGKIIYMYIVVFLVRLLLLIGNATLGVSAIERGHPS